VLREAEAATQTELEPSGDAHASAEYRKEVAGVLVRRALAQTATEGGGR
jgi:CO/xanthine dehydrogenase FAD-binding subunit